MEWDSSDLELNAIKLKLALFFAADLALKKTFHVYGIF
jgi:hypothetical protein